MHVKDRPRAFFFGTMACDKPGHRFLMLGAGMFCGTDDCLSLHKCVLLSRSSWACM